MQVSLETTSSLGRRLTVVVPAEQFEQEFATRLSRLSRQVKMPGFRPGKVPTKVVEARYSGQLLEEVAGDLIERTLREAIGEQQLRPAGGTRIQHKPLARGQGLEYTAEFEIYPEITRLDLSGVEIERPLPQIEDSDIDKTLESVRRQRATWNPVDRPAQREDRVMVDSTARVDGAEIEGGKAENHAVVIGSGRMFAEIEDALVGCARGDTRRVVVNFPAEAANKALAGKAVEFEIQVKEVAEPVLPDVNGEFAKGLGVVDGGVDALRAEIRASLEREANERVRTLLRGSVFKALREVSAFDVPVGMIAAEVERMKKIAASARGDASTPDPNDDTFYRARAQTRVSLGLILSEIVRARGFKADPTRVRARVEHLARDYDAPEKFVEWYYANPQHLAEVESAVLEEQVVEYLLTTAQVQDRPTPFPDLLKMEVPVD
jgi:trigger factor